ncbi:MAG: sigma-54-dependent transcriptional regulator [Calditrichota bacterium]
MPKVILIVDDDARIAATLQQQLKVFGYNSIVAADGKTAEQLITERDYDLVLLDLALPDTNGAELLKGWTQRGVNAPVIVISGTATVADAVNAMKRGAADFLVKPIDMQILEAVVHRVLAAQRLNDENRRLKQLTGTESAIFLGESDAVRSLLQEAERFAIGDNPILLEGETGTGKQVLARYIHAKSDRRTEPFVAVNCAAITETLFESELFGHEKGAFTGAISRKPGKLELVGKGTLFLDEVGELPVLCQAKLLTAVEDRSYERVGGLRPLQFEGRIIAATNRDIAREIRDQRFRADLYYRLGAFHLKLPSLRSRPEDIPIFVSAAIKQSRRRYGRDFLMPTDEVLLKLAKYPWPGNVRELLHHVERIALLSDNNEIKSSLWLSFPSAQIVAPMEDEDDLRMAQEAHKKRHILRVVAKCGGNQTEAAKCLGIERTHLNRLLSQYEGRRSP